MTPCAPQRWRRGLEDCSISCIHLLSLKWSGSSSSHLFLNFLFSSPLSSLVAPLRAVTKRSLSSVNWDAWKPCPALAEALLTPATVTELLRVSAFDHTWWLVVCCFQVPPLNPIWLPPASFLKMCYLSSHSSAYIYEDEYSCLSIVLHSSLSCIWFFPDHFSSLSILAWILILSSSVRTLLGSLVSAIVMTVIISILSSRIFKDILNNTRSKAEPCKITLDHFLLF